MRGMNGEKQKQKFMQDLPFYFLQLLITMVHSYMHVCLAVCKKKWKKKQKVVKLPDSFGSTGDQCCHSLQTPPAASATIVRLIHFCFSLQ